MAHKIKADTVSKLTTIKVDSASVVVGVKKKSDTPSLFKNHLLISKHKYPEVHVIKHNYVTTTLLFVLFVLFVWLYAFNFKTLTQVITNFFQFKSGSKRSRDGATIGNRAFIFFSLFFVTTLSMLTGKLLHYYNIKLFSTRIPDEVIIGLLIIATYTVKFMVIKFAGYLFKLQQEANDYILQIISFCNTLGLFLLPVIMLLSFLKQISPLVFIYTGVVIVSVFMVIRAINTIVLGLGNSSKISKFYLFIYLCSLEILPFIIIVKLIIIKFK